MMRAFNGLVTSPLGGGTRETIVSNTSLTPSPVLAEQRIASEASMPITSPISSITRSGSADGKSILFNTGVTSTPCSIAV